MPGGVGGVAGAILPPRPDWASSSRYLSLLGFRLFTNLVHSGFAASGAVAESSGFTRRLVADAAGIPDIAFVTTGTFGEPLFGSRSNRRECLGRENEFEESMF
jgi:hypothetical protein